MKKLKILGFIWVIAAITMLSFEVAATDSAQNWYCAHRLDHKQPTVDPSIAYVQDYNGFYIDKKHGDDSSDKVVYLTFDAGYENGNISKILDVMKEENVTGAFFILGNLIEKNSELIIRMFDEGHLVCNHTYSHKPMVNKSKAEIEEELCKLESACIEKTGKSISKYYRPPEGRFDRSSIQYVSELGYKTVFWSFAYVDWDNNDQMSSDSAKKKIMENIHNGEVMLLHPTSSTNAEIFSDVIRELKEQGYRFGTLDELCS
ncbi:MAG: delta-lactam-biosynthetic de-N-acetylase [Ruminococcaceae bacterium]|nr:delta-lactam-biosynthetic de-N-acetylase [Oscillospiraceae bacterium]